MKKRKVVVILGIILLLAMGGVLFFVMGGHKYYVRTSFNDKEMQKGEFVSFEEAKKCADANYVYGYRVYNAFGKVKYSTYSILVMDILREAKYVTDYVRKNSFTYGDAPVNPAINHDAKKISCDRLVGWVLYRVGYTEHQPTQSGLFVWAPGDPRDLEDFCKKHGFKKIEIVEDLQPGDIVFVNHRSKDRPDHTFIYGGKVSSTNHFRYDCGSDHRIQSIQPFSEPVVDFLFAYRPV
ncbi:MAG: hypothetical protein ACOX3J_08475 [Clostridia bacterium]|jgi:hypothetical protein|nr:hypothetical protein [Clostridiaceae bacterium]HOA31223.1 hypothetical protein [Clostridia bacterium]